MTDENTLSSNDSTSHWSETTLFYDEGGPILAVGYLDEAGQKVGRWRVWAEDGSLISDHIWVDGERMQVAGSGEA